MRIPPTAQWAERSRSGSGPEDLTGRCRPSRVALMRAPLFAAAAVLACSGRQMPPPAKLAVAAPAERTPAVQGSSGQIASIAQRYWSTLLATTPLPLLGE